MRRWRWLDSSNGGSDGAPTPGEGNGVNKGNAWSAGVAGFLPRFAKRANLRRLLNAEGLAGLTAQPPPTLAIVDVMFPGGDGFLLTRTARDQGVRGEALDDLVAGHRGEPIIGHAHHQVRRRIEQLHR